MILELEGNIDTFNEILTQGTIDISDDEWNIRVGIFLALIEVDDYGQETGRVCHRRVQKVIHSQGDRGILAIAQVSPVLISKELNV